MCHHHGERDWEEIVARMREADDAEAPTDDERVEETALESDREAEEPAVTPADD
jgi:hypothetical protein